MNRAELKSLAKAQIKGKIGILFVVTLIIAVVSGLASFILSFIPVVGSLAAAIIVTPALSLSLVRIYMCVVNGELLKSRIPSAVLTISGQHLR